MNKHAEDIVEEDLLEQVSFEIGKDVFKGPFICHGATTKVAKQIVLNGITFPYQSWQCRCGKEFLDSQQARELENIWRIEKLLHGNLIHFDRSINNDGKMYFFRFPKEFTNHWHPDMKAHVELLGNNEFLVKVE